MKERLSRTAALNHALFAAQRLMAVIACITLIFPPHIMQAYAQSIKADPNTPATMRPNIGAAPNGVPLIDIVAPNKSGLSPNKVEVFSVESPGAILNNTSETMRSQLGGIIPGNPNLTNGAATAILIDITGKLPSHLKGPLEINGQAADIIVSNKQGFLINGASFINTPKVTLSTGVPIYSDGVLQGYAVHQGTVEIGEGGMNTRNVRDTEIFARAVKILGEVSAQNLNIIADANTIDAQTGKVTPLDSDAGNGEIYITPQGIMYADKIRMKCTGDGCGVNHEGSINALENMFAEAGGKVTLDGPVTTEGDLILTPGKDSNIGINKPVTVGGDAVIDSEKDITITSGLDVAGKADIRAVDTVRINNGFVSAEENITVEGNEVRIENNGAIEGGIPKTIIKADLFKSTNGKVYGYGDVEIRADIIDIQNSELVAKGKLTAQAQETRQPSLLYKADNSVVDSSDANVAINANNIEVTTKSEKIDNSTLGEKLRDPNAVITDANGNQVTNIYALEPGDWASYLEFINTEIQRKIQDVRENPDDLSGVTVIQGALDGLAPVYGFISQPDEQGEIQAYQINNFFYLDKDTGESFFSDADLPESELYGLKPKVEHIGDILRANDITPMSLNGIVEITDTDIAKITQDIIEKTRPEWWDVPRPYTIEVPASEVPDETPVIPGLNFADRPIYENVVRPVLPENNLPRYTPEERSEFVSLRSYFDSDYFQGAVINRDSLPETVTRRIADVHKHTNDKRNIIPIKKPVFLEKDRDYLLNNTNPESKFIRQAGSRNDRIYRSSWTPPPLTHRATGIDASKKFPDFIKSSSEATYVIYRGKYITEYEDRPIKVRNPAEGGTLYIAKRVALDNEDNAEVRAVMRGICNITRAHGKSCGGMLAPTSILIDPPTQAEFISTWQNYGLTDAQLKRLHKAWYRVSMSSRTHGNIGNEGIPGSGGAPGQDGIPRSGDAPGCDGVVYGFEGCPPKKSNPKNNAENLNINEVSNSTIINYISGDKTLIGAFFIAGVGMLAANSYLMLYCDYNKCTSSLKKLISNFSTRHALEAALCLNRDPCRIIMKDISEAFYNGFISTKDEAENLVIIAQSNPSEAKKKLKEAKESTEANTGSPMPDPDDSDGEINPKNLIATEKPSKSGIKKYKKKIKEGEYIEPIKVAKIGGRYYIVDGHHRAAAARSLNVRLRYKIVNLSKKEEDELLTAAAELVQKSY